MIRVTYHDPLEAAPVVNFHALAFRHGEPVEVPDDWSGLEAVRNHPHFSVDNGHGVAHPASDADRDGGVAGVKETGVARHGKAHASPKAIDKSEPLPAISIGEARAWGRDAFASGHRRQAPAHYSRSQRKAWLEGFDRARRKART
jgi:hypothetical protein